MDGMTLPNKETLQYLDIIEKWSLNMRRELDGIYIDFKPNTPENLIQLLDKIKDKLPFKIIIN